MRNVPTAAGASDNPAGWAEAHPRDPADQGAITMAGSTVLVVDDEPRIVQFLEENLRADDYVTKPFHYPELLARMSGLLKRANRIDERHKLVIGELVVNTLSKEVTVGGVAVHLSVKEFQLLSTLAAQPERVFSKQELLEQVWGFKSPGRTRTLESHASRLRQKLGQCSDRSWIVNTWGHGYRVCAPE